VGGFRIELGEIEAVLGRHPGVREALVVAQAGTQPGSKRLTAYLVAAPGGSPSAGELRAFLGERLPAYMVPADFVALEAFPLSANGKVDRQALPSPSPRPGAAETSAAPGSPVEELVAGFFREVLQIDRVGVDDNFFELGGNSPCR
jgi:acyl-coenzyme A synthetase/AMP-(fatty) acid ligase